MPRGRPPKQPPQPGTFRIIVRNDRESGAYIRLFSPEWEKENVTVEVGEMADPTINKKVSATEHLQGLLDVSRQGRLQVEGLYLWCPTMIQHAEIFTLHVYEETGQETFEDLRVFYFRYDPDQVRGDVSHWDDLQEVFLTKLTRISFALPAYTKMFLDINYLL